MYGFILYFCGGKFWTSYMLTFEEYLLTYLLKKHHHTHLFLQTFVISCGRSFLERDLPKYRWLLGNIHNTEIECTPPPIYSLLLSSVFSRQQELLGGAEAFFLSTNQKLIFTEIRDKQTSQTEAEFVTCSKISQ